MARKKPSRARPAPNPRFSVTLPRDVAAALAAYLAAIEARGEAAPDKSRVCATALREHLRRLGHYPPPSPGG